MPHRKPASNIPKAAQAGPREASKMNDISYRPKTPGNRLHFRIAKWLEVEGEGTLAVAGAIGLCALALILFFFRN